MAADLAKIGAALAACADEAENLSKLNIYMEGEMSSWLALVSPAAYWVKFYIAT